MAICKHCDKEFEFPAYIDCYTSHLYPMEQGGWTNSKNGWPVYNPPRKAPACPFCGGLLHQGDVNHYHHPDGIITTEISGGEI